MSQERLFSARLRDNLQLIAEDNKQGTGLLFKQMSQLEIWPDQSVSRIATLDERFITWWLDTVRPTYNRENAYPTSPLPVLYFLSRDVIGPLRVSFSLSVMKEAEELDAQVHFLARDGFSEYVASKILHNDTATKVNYIPLSVKLMRKAEENEAEKELLIQYLKQFGVDQPGKHIFVDIGFNGEILSRLAKLFPNLQTDMLTRFFVSKVSHQMKVERPEMVNTSGFLFDQTGANDDTLSSILNRVEIMRALEDTWGGLKTSTRQVTVQPDIIKPMNFVYKQSFEQRKRVIAMMGIRDAARIVSSQDMSNEVFLAQKPLFVKNFTDIFSVYSENDLLDVLCSPHEPTNY